MPQVFLFGSNMQTKFAPKLDPVAKLEGNDGGKNLEISAVCRSAVARRCLSEGSQVSKRRPRLTKSSVPFLLL